MSVNRLNPEEKDLNPLGKYLQDRRARLDPAELGFIPGRRRTPGLRREEVAQRANISPAWYAWLEQGRGGAPSPEALGRIADSLMLSEEERDHLFFLALGRAPHPNYKVQSAITPRLQRFLDSMETTAAIIKTATWDVIGWNKAATVILADFEMMPLASRNTLRCMFTNTRELILTDEWMSVARYAVNTFRADVAKAGALLEVEEMIDELSACSPEFYALWHDNDVRTHQNNLLFINHTRLGLMELEYSRFAVDGRQDLSMIAHRPTDPVVAERIRQIVNIEIANSPTLRQPS